MVRHVLLLVIATVLLVPGVGTSFGQGLMIQIKNCPKTVKAGQNLGSAFQVAVTNLGDVAAKDVEVALVLKKGPLCPQAGRPVVYSPNFFDGVLLRDGRQYVNLEAGQSAAVRLFGTHTIPADTPVGKTYYLCAAIIAGGQGAKPGEAGSCACCPIAVVGKEEPMVITGVTEKCAARRGTLTILGRNFGAAAAKVVVLGGMGIKRDLPVISWSDTAIAVRIPDDAGIREGGGCSISIQRADHSEVLSNSMAIVICGEKAPTGAPVPVQPLPPVPPFLF